MHSAASADLSTALYSYRIASADMKFIEIHTREIYLREDEERGLVLRGEIPGCGPACGVDLGEVFLEYAMSCKGCADTTVLMESVTQFGERLGAKFTSTFINYHRDHDTEQLVSIIFECVLDSMGGNYQKHHADNHLHFQLLKSPIEASAGQSSLQLWSMPAQQGFRAFIESILKILGGGWVLMHPEPGEPAAVLSAIRIQKSF